MRRSLSVGPLLLGALLVLPSCRPAPAEEDNAAAAPKGASSAALRAPAPADEAVELGPAGVAAAEIELVPVETVSSRTLPVTGTLTFDANAVAKVGPNAEGRIVAIRHDLGDRVARGATLATLESPELGELQGELARARTADELARKSYEREKSLYEQRVSSEKEMLEARAAYESTRADLEAARAKLEALGASPGQGAAFAVTAPIAGTVVERDAVVGQIAGPDDALFTVADLERLWLLVDVYENDVAEVAAGQQVRVRTEAFPGEVFAGTLSYVGQVVDPESRTVKSRVVVENRHVRLRPGMFARAEIVLPEPAGTLAVPQQAVQDLRGKQVVFVPVDRGRFRPVEVTTGAVLEGGRVIVASGLQTGQEVVGRGSFALKSELLKSTFGDTD